MTQPKHPTVKHSNSVEEIFREFLGEYHDHRCGCGSGCINCRQTGYNQTPCLLCDKDGVAFKNVEEAKERVKALLQSREIESRLDELKETVIAQGTYDEDRRYGHGSFHHVPSQEVENRIKELEAQISREV